MSAGEALTASPRPCAAGTFYGHISDQQAFCPADRKYIQNVHDPSLDKCMNSYYTALHMTSRGRGMSGRYLNEIHRINCLTTETEALYHLSSLRLGITDSVSIVLYFAHVAGGECLLGDVYKSSGISRQTVNSAVRTLEARGFIQLERFDGRAKSIRLTDSGREYAERTVARLYKAEADALEAWPEGEVAEYIRLMEKYTDCLRREIEKL